MRTLRKIPASSTAKKLIAASLLTAANSATGRTYAGPVAAAVMLVAFMLAWPYISAEAKENAKFPPIEFGSNVGELAFNDSCNDPRFKAISEVNIDHWAEENHLFADAADCHLAWQREHIELLAIDTSIYGFDAAEMTWVRNGVCNDPRFTPSPRYPQAVNLDAGQVAEREDATDCFRGRLSRQAWLKDEELGIAFGDDSGEWEGDEECDDPRFEENKRFVATPGVEVTRLSDTTLARNLFRDATDCLQAVRAGTVVLTTLNDDERAIFGDDSGDWAFDGECDDPRFEESTSFDAGTDDSKPRMSDVTLAQNQFRDATDCLRAVRAGTVVLTTLNDDERAIFGDDSGDWAFDGECDDPRFEESTSFDAGTDDSKPRMSDVTLAQNQFRDATDCLRAVRAGTVVLTTLNDDERAIFGDDSGEWAFDGECDDPRFEGMGTAVVVDPEMESKDATDCLRAFRKGEVNFRN